MQKETKWLEGVVIKLNHTLNQPELSDNVRIQRQYDLQMAANILHHLKGEKTKFKNFSRFKDYYQEWYNFQVKAKYKWDVASAVNLNKIIAFLIDANDEKTEEAAFTAWQQMLCNWQKLSPFLQRQKGILQINKNLNEIVDQIKNGYGKSDPNKLNRDLGI